LGLKKKKNTLNATLSLLSQLIIMAFYPSSYKIVTELYYFQGTSYMGFYLFHLQDRYKIITYKIAV